MNQKNTEYAADTMVPRDYQIRIARDGTWYHQEGPIRRDKLVKLFATVLSRRDDGQYWLKTPAEQGVVTVDDAPFVIVALRVEEPGTAKQVIHFTTNLDRELTLSSAYPMIIMPSPVTGEPTPYIEMERGLSARINRNVYYELAELGTLRNHGNETIMGVTSKGEFYELGAVSENHIG
jgi:uncharacterized protein